MEERYLYLLAGSGGLSLFLLLFLLVWWDAPAPWKSRWCPYLHPTQLCHQCAYHYLPPPLAPDDPDIILPATVAGCLLLVLLAIMAFAPLVGCVGAALVFVGVGTAGRDVRICLNPGVCPQQGAVYECPLERPNGKHQYTQ